MKMRASFYECDITPPLGGYMPGQYGQAFALDVVNRLYAKALVIENEGNLAAILVVDTCGMPAEMTDIVTKRIYEYTGIRAESVCICSNHTHRGAPISDSPELNLYSDKTYKDVFFRLAADAVILAYKRLESATVSFACTEVNGISFNRNCIMDDGTYRTNSFEGAVGRLAGIDPALSILVFERDGKKIGAVINYALHQDTTDSIPGYTGDYSSILSKRLKEEYGNDFVSLFLLGTCGDINHLDGEKEAKGIFERRQYINIGNRLADEVISIAKNTTPVDGSISLSKEKITLKKRTLDETEARETVKRFMEEDIITFASRNLLYYFSTNETDETEAYIQVIRIGDVCIYALPGEIYVNWGLLIKEKSPFGKNIVVELSNSALGYVPTLDAFSQNSLIYETLLCYSSCLVPGAGQDIVDKALEMAGRLKSKEL